MYRNMASLESLPGLPDERKFWYYKITRGTIILNSIAFMIIIVLLSLFLSGDLWIYRLLKSTMIMLFNLAICCLSTRLNIRAKHYDPKILPQNEYLDLHQQLREADMVSFLYIFFWTQGFH